MTQPREFSYKAVKRDGQVVEGRTTAGNEREVALRLQMEGQTPLQVVPFGDPFSQGRPSALTSLRLPDLSALSRKQVSLSFWKQPSRRDLIMFAEDLAVLLGSGISLSRSLTILADLTTKKSFKAVIQDVHNRIREGGTLWESLQHHRKVFPPVFVNMVKAGESGGVLDSVLVKLAEYLNQVQELKEYVVSAMIYPAVLLLTAGASMLILLTFVIPKFADIFSDMGVALPTATRVMLASGQFLESYWWVLLLGVALLTAAFRTYVRSPRGRRVWGLAKLRTPLLGPVLKKIEISRFSRTLGTLLASGVSILAAMQIVRGVVLNPVLNSLLGDIYQDLKHGQVLSRALEKSGFFPTLAVHMVGVGEETGRMDVMLTKVAEVYDKELRVTIKSLTSLFEPLVILVMGLIIGAMVVSMLLAIFSVNELGM